MRSNRLYIQSATRYAVLTPLIATAATIYALCGAFQSLDTSQATWRTAAEGIVRADATTGALLFISILLLVPLRAWEEAAVTTAAQPNRPFERAGMNPRRPKGSGSAGRSTPLR